MANVIECAWVAKPEKPKFSFDGTISENSKEETSSCVTVDNKLTFYNHIKEFFKETSLREYLLCQEFHHTQIHQKKV